MMLSQFDDQYVTPFITKAEEQLYVIIELLDQLIVLLSQQSVIYVSLLPSLY